jgi:hypothetical protein
MDSVERWIDKRFAGTGWWRQMEQSIRHTVDDRRQKKLLWHVDFE